MKRTILLKIRSYLWRNDKQNPAIKEIDSAIDTNLHPQTEIKHVFSQETTKTIQDVQKVLESPANKRKYN